MTAQEFQKQEDLVFRRWATRHCDSSTTYYHRQYRCDCGYTTTSPKRIFEHVCRAPVR